MNLGFIAGYAIGLYLGIGIGMMWVIAKLCAPVLGVLEHPKTTVAIITLIWPYVLYQDTFADKRVHRKQAFEDATKFMREQETSTSPEDHQNERERS